MNFLGQIQLDKRFLHFAIPVLLAALLVAGLFWAMGSVTPVGATSVSDSANSSIINSNVITIGVAAAMSGPADFLGWRQVNAVQLAIDQINAGGGVDIGGTNYSIALVTADSACNPTQAVAAANTLLNTGAVAVVGHSCSSATMAAQSVYATAGVPMISASSSSTQITEQGYTTTFRVITRDDSPPAMLATHLRNHLAHERAAVVDIQGTHGSTLSSAFADTFTSLGGTITSQQSLTSTADFTATLTTVMAENPDAIHFANGDGSNAGLLSKVAHNLGMTDVVIAWTTTTQDRSVLDDYSTVAGTAAEGDIAVMYFRAADDMPGYPTFSADYIAAGFANYGDDPQFLGAFAYDAAQIIVAAIDRADSVISSDIRDEIAAMTDFQGVVGPYEGFDAKGDVIPQWAWLEQYQDGEWAKIGLNEIFLPIVIKD